MVGVIRIGINPVLFHIGGLAVHWYGIMYALAFFVAYRFGALPHLTARGVPRATVERLTTWTILFGLLGARLYYVIQQPDLGDFLSHPIRIISVWEGGMAFFGAIFASLATIAFFSWRQRLPFWLLWDAGVIFAVIGQPIGRIGNLINGDILGSRSSLPWATAYTFHTSADHCAVLQQGFLCGVGYQPAALYEALGTLAILGLLLVLRRRGAPIGLLGITYVAAYAISQIILFQFRESEPAIFLGLKQAQLTAIAVLVVLVPALVVIWQTTGRQQPQTAPSQPEPEAPDRPPEAAGRRDGFAQSTAIVYGSTRDSHKRKPAGT
jgi:phosphatidylglycerol:prolipoprotein diacylglycerol transferase